jgi:Flp pilus assembly protein TadG
MSFAKRLFKPFVRLARARRGNVAVVTGLVMLPLALVGAMAVEATGISNDKAVLQAAADAGALAGATEMSVASRGTDGIIETARTVAMQAAEDLDQGGTLHFTVNVNRDAGSVTVEGNAMRTSTLGMAGLGDNTLYASATAEALQQAPLCILQTGKSGIANLKVDDTGRITALGCLVHANRDIEVVSRGSINAGRVQAVGKVTGTMSPAGNAGALPVADPFADLDLNPPTGCAGKDSELKLTGNEVYTLAAGVHCQEIKIGGNATLRLAPGEHYFMEEIDFHGNAKLFGEDVVLIFDTDDSFKFGEKADVELSARTSGVFAGFLIATSRRNDETFTISSDRVRELLGTIYIPEAELMISTSGNVADQSAWSVIVARAITLKENPNLVINTNYVASGVPVPDGVGPSEGAPRLTR